MTKKKFRSAPFIRICIKKLLGSILGRDPPFIKVSWKSVLQFSCNLAVKPANQQTNNLGGGHKSMWSVHFNILYLIITVFFFKMFTPQNDPTVGIGTIIQNKIIRIKPPPSLTLVHTRTHTHKSTTYTGAYHTDHGWRPGMRTRSSALFPFGWERVAVPPAHMLHASSSTWTLWLMTNQLMLIRMKLIPRRHL